MLPFKDIFTRNRYFFIPFVLITIFTSVPLIACTKDSLHIHINGWHCSFFDTFFKLITNMGDGLFALAVGIIFLFFSFRKSLFILSAYLGGGLIVQLLKRFVFSDILRPAKYFEGVYNLHLIEGINMRKYMSFPSGHAATAFGLFLCLAVFSRNNLLKTIWFMVAVLIAFSRVYLSQHFIIDVYFGSLTGVTCTLIMYRFVYLIPGKWADKNLNNLFSRGKAL